MAAHVAIVDIVLTDLASVDLRPDEVMLDAPIPQAPKGNHHERRGPAIWGTPAAVIWDAR